MASGAAGTADGPMVIVAAEQAEPRPLVRDDVVLRMAGPGVRMLVRWAPVRRWLTRVTDRQMPGLWGGMLCRKRYAEDGLRAALADGVTEVIILGAGLDTLAYRVPEAARAHVYEVDLPANIDRKRTRLTRAFGRVPDHVTLVPLDFDTEDLTAALEAAGHRMDTRTFVVWEAVTQYLTESGVRTTLDHLSKSAPGSRLVFTYIRTDFLTGTNLYNAPTAHHRFAEGPHPLWRFGLNPPDVAPFLAQHNWHEREQLGPSEFTERYLSHRPLETSEIERSVLAERP